VLARLPSSGSEQIDLNTMPEHTCTESWMKRTVPVEGDENDELPYESPMLLAMHMGIVSLVRRVGWFVPHLACPWPPSDKVGSFSYLPPSSSAFYALRSMPCSSKIF
jgi:hypothetical protein